MSRRRRPRTLTPSAAWTWTGCWRRSSASSASILNTGRSVSTSTGRPGRNLLLQAYLQKIVNGGGRIEREYALGRGRVDLLVVWPHGGRDRRFVVECKVRRDGLERTIREGVEQTRGYMDRCGAESGHLVVFDRSPSRTWEEKIFRPRRVDPRRRSGHRLGHVTASPGCTELSSTTPRQTGWRDREGDARDRGNGAGDAEFLHQVR